MAHLILINRDASTLPKFLGTAYHDQLKDLFIQQEQRIMFLILAVSRDFLDNT